MMAKDWTEQNAWNLLEEENGQLRSFNKELLYHNEQQFAEIERLREALKGTACNCPNVNGDEYEEGDECFCDAQYELQENCPYLKARSALQQKESEL